MMDIIGILIFFGIIAINIDYINDIRGLIIPTRKKATEIILMVMGTTVLLVITYFYAKTLMHNIIGILGAISLILSFSRQGITYKGFRSIRGLRYSGNWDKLKSVHIYIKSDVIMSIIHQNFSEDVHYYRKEDYDKIITLMNKHLSNEIVKKNKNEINHKEI